MNKKPWPVPTTAELNVRADELFQAGHIKDALALRDLARLITQNRFLDSDIVEKAQATWILHGDGDRTRILRRIDHCLTSLCLSPDACSMLSAAFQAVTAMLPMSPKQERALIRSERKLQKHAVPLTIAVRKTMDTCMSIHDVASGSNTGPGRVLNKVFRHYCDGILLRDDLSLVEATFNNALAELRQFKFRPGMRCVCWFNQHAPIWSKNKPYAKIAMVLDTPKVVNSNDGIRTDMPVNGNIAVTVMLDDGTSHCVSLGRLETLEDVVKSGVTIT